MKKTLSLFTLLLVSLICLSFNKNDKVESILCDKEWQTPAISLKDTKVIIVFKSNKVYEQYYKLGNDKTPYVGTWSMTGDKISIKFKGSNIEDSFQILSIKNDNLVLETKSAGKKIFQLNK